MGFLAWMLVGLAVALGARVMVGAVRWHRGQPSISASLIGAVLGGFFADLLLRGDSVTVLRGPSLVGATIGAGLVLVTAILLGWTSTPHRDAA